jgi:hypothetical protein
MAAKRRLRPPKGVTAHHSLLSVAGRTGIGESCLIADFVGGTIVQRDANGEFRTKLSKILSGGTMNGKATGPVRPWRVILGFLVAGALAVLLIVVVLIIPGLPLGSPSGLPIGWGVVLIALIPVLRLGVPSSVLVALPLYLWLSRTGRLSIWWAVGVGAATGATAGLYPLVEFLWIYARTIPDLWFTLRMSGVLGMPVIGVLTGAVCGLAGWLIMFGPPCKPDAMS